MLRKIAIGVILFSLISTVVACTGPTSTPAPAPTPPPALAAFQTAGLMINPPEIDPGQELSITATVTNTGDIKGSYMAELKINDTTQQTIQVIVDAGEPKVLTFVVVKDTPGIYEVAIGEVTGQFEVVEPVTLPQSRSPTIADSTTPRSSEPTRPGSRPGCCS